jgi:ribosomal protein S18 acetylase RimI-like enzyme
MPRDLGMPSVDPPGAMPRSPCVPGQTVGDAFVARYRQRPDLGYLPPPSWVRGAPAHFLRRDIAVFTIDEMGKANVCPIVFADEPDADAAERMLRAAAAASHPARLEVRVAGDRPARKVANRSGFAVDRVQAGMRAELGVFPDQRGEALVMCAVPPAEEIRDLYNACFGLTLSVADVERMRGHPAWDDGGFFQIRDGGRAIAALRLVVDEDIAGSRYGFLRGLAIHPDHRQASIRIMFALYRTAIERLAALGVTRCHLLVDRATGQGGSLMRRLYTSLGFIEDCLVYRFREPFVGAARMALTRQ